MMYSVSDIVWDIDDDDIDPNTTQEELGLPIKADIEADDADEVAEQLANKYGFLVLSLAIEKSFDKSNS